MNCFKTYYERLSSISEEVAESFDALPTVEKIPFSRIKHVWDSHLEAYMKQGVVPRELIKELRAGESAMNFLLELSALGNNPVVTHDGIVFALANTVAGEVYKPQLS